MLNNLDILQIFSEGACPSGNRAARFAACLAEKLGANLFIVGNLPTDLSNAFYDAPESAISQESVPEWQAQAPSGRCRLVLTSAPHSGKERDIGEGSKVIIHLDPWETEETLFASSGVAELLGDPDRAPLVPAANYAAHTIGYAAFAAVVSLALKHARFGEDDQAAINGPGILAWVNWKSAIVGSFGMQSIRQGSQAEWPVLECADGHAAFVFNERDWKAVVDMTDNAALRAEEFSTFEGRQNNRDGYMQHIRAWFKDKSKVFLNEQLVKYAIPGAAVSTVTDLLSDPLLTHRETFQSQSRNAKLPLPAHRIAREIRSVRPATDDSGECRLPLSGVRVLDFGIITAGAGVSALLADMGAEILKIESSNRADPFRVWPGSGKSEDSDSPLFKSNNRNKKGVAIDLKTDEGIAQFIELAKSADVVLENYRRGVLDRLGLTFDVLRQANPKILLASISGQGLDGPGSEHTTFGSTLEASSGFASLTCYDDDLPVISGRNLNYPDQIVCLYGAGIVAAAAIDCRRNGIARQIDVSQRDCAVYQLGDILAHISNGGEASLDAIRAATARPMFSEMIRCGDNKYAALVAHSPDIAAAIGGLDSLDTNAVRAWAGTRPAVEAVSAFKAAGGGGAVSRSGLDLVEDRSLFDSEIFARSPNGALVKGFPFQLVRTPMTIHSNSPKVGEHTEKILGHLNR